jgi:hypothetical protein
MELNMTKDEALNLAMDWYGSGNQDPDEFMRLILSIVAQPEQPKVRTGNCLRVGVCASEGHKIQPQRTWVGMTDEEKNSFWKADQMTQKEWDELFSDIEAKLKELNS